MGYLLTKKTKRFLENPDKYPNKSIYYKRIEAYSIAALQDLTFIAEHLPEDRCDRIYTRENFDPLVCSAILLGKDLPQNPRTERHYQLARLFAECGLNVCQEKIHSRNPDAVSLVAGAFNEVRQVIWSSIPIEDKRPLVTLECPKCKHSFERRIDPRAPITRCPKCTHKFKFTVETES